MQRIEWRGRWGAKADAVRICVMHFARRARIVDGA